MKFERWRLFLPALPVALAALFLSGCDDNNSGSGTVTAATVTANPSTGSATTVFNFTGQITATDDAPITYRWEHDDGAMSEIGTLAFSEAGTLTVTHTWDPDGCSTTAPRERWVRLQVLTPNALTSSQTIVRVDPAATCP